LGDNPVAVVVPQAALVCPGTSYAFRVQARNNNNIPTAWVSLGSQSTLSNDPPVIDSINFNGCISELCTTPIHVKAHDPEGGNLSYAWTALNGGTITGSGASVVFDPPNSGPHPCPYKIQVVVTSDASGLSTSQSFGITVKLGGDADGDGDVDIFDLKLIRDHFNETPNSPGWDPRADVDCNGAVNVFDLKRVRDQFNSKGCACP